MKYRKYKPQLYEQYSEAGSRCFYCRDVIQYDFITKDHFLPRSKGNTLKNNKVFACNFCNTSKHNMTIMEFRDWANNKVMEHNSKKSDYSYKILKLLNIFHTCDSIVKGNVTPIFFT